MDLLIAALPMGDDTPILLYAILALLAIAALVAVTLMGKKQPPRKK